MGENGRKGEQNVARSRCDIKKTGRKLAECMKGKEQRKNGETYLLQKNINSKRMKGRI